MVVELRGGAQTAGNHVLIPKNIILENFGPPWATLGPIHGLFEILTQIFNFFCKKKNWVRDRDLRLWHSFSQIQLSFTWYVTCTNRSSTSVAMSLKSRKTGGVFGKNRLWRSGFAFDDTYWATLKRWSNAFFKGFRMVYHSIPYHFNFLRYGLP